MRVRAIINFNDLQEKVKRIANESEWECTDERAKYLLDNNAIEIIEEQPVLEVVEPEEIELPETITLELKKPKKKKPSKK